MNGNGRYVGQFDLCNTALCRGPGKPVVLDSSILIGRRSRSTVGQNAGGLHAPAVLTRRPNSFSESAIRIEQPRADLLPRRIPSNNLSPLEIDLPVDHDMKGVDEKIATLGPAIAGFNLPFTIRIISPFAHQPV